MPSGPQAGRSGRQATGWPLRAAASALRGSRSRAGSRDARTPRATLATILDLAELGLAHADQATIASARPVVEQVQSLLAGGADEPGSDGVYSPEGDTN